MYDCQWFIAVLKCDVVMWRDFLALMMIMPWHANRLDTLNMVSKRKEMKEKEATISKNKPEIKMK